MKCLLLLSSLLIVSGCGSRFSEEMKSEIEKAPEHIDYNFHVKPILSDRCFACHGPDAQNQKSKLRLDNEADAYAALNSGNGHAIVPRNTNKSQLVVHILSEDKEIMMPPLESNLALTNIEKAILIKWIDQGAQYAPHWAFIKPIEPVVPTIEGNWPKNEIDNFILDKLNRNEISPAQEANRAQLIRRLFFDITGLPPTLEDLDKWMVKDDSYYEQLVDSLLSTPAYGERMAAHWLDVARFADSEGYLDDFHHALALSGLGHQSLQ